MMEKEERERQRERENVSEDAYLVSFFLDAIFLINSLFSDNCLVKWF